MEYSYLTRSLSISPVDEILRRVLIYVPLFIQLYILRQDFLPTVFDSSSSSFIIWMTKPRNLGEPLSAVSFVLALYTFQRQYTFNKIHISKANRSAKIQFNGLIPAAVNCGVGLLRASFYLFGLQDADRMLLHDKFLKNGLIVALASSVSILFCLTYKMNLQDSRAILYYRLGRFWKSAHSVIIIALFLWVCFFHRNQVIQIIFRVTLIIISFSMLRRMQVREGILIKLNFIRSFMDAKVLFLVLATCSYFEVFKIIEFKAIGLHLESTFINQLTYDFVEALILFMLCARHSMYYELNIISSNLLFGNRHEHPMLSSAFIKREGTLLRTRSWFFSYFMDRILGVMELSTKDVFAGGEQLKNGFIRDMLKESDELRFKFLKYVKTRFQNLESKKNYNELSFKAKTIMVDYSITFSFSRD